jgi:tetratricopeptide (TPR) repeat protein
MHRLADLINAGRFAELEPEARELVRRYPTSGHAWQILGIALSRQGKDALEALCTASRLLPNDAGAQVNVGNALGRLGRLDEAVASYRTALALSPDFAEAHQNLGHALLDLGRADDAAASCRRAVELNPRSAAAQETLGNAWLLLGRLEDAAASYRRALEIEPEFSEIHYNLGNALRGLGKLDEAVASYRRALEIEPNFAAAHCDFGIALRLQGRIAEAQASCRRALAINARSAAAYVALADSSAVIGRFAEAEELFKRAISIEAESPEAWAGLVRLRKMTLADATWLAHAQRIADRPLPARQEVQLRYAIGKYFDDVADFDQAFSNFRRANELSKRHRGAHDRHKLTQVADHITQFYDRAWLAGTRGRALDSARPLLIVGMLRSGTTLAEQILASHPAVHGAGELPFWSNASPIYESSALEASASLLRGLADDYSRLLRDLSGDALRVVDKMPTNFAFLGLIHAALPNARIIHMRRNALDTCLSIYFQYFEAMVSYANDLEDLAHYHREYQRVMQHWRSVLPREIILDVPYEGLVADPELWSRKMVEFAGLSWDARCLDFHATDRAVITASQWQVRQKISTSSVGRWRNYEKFLGSLRRLLDPDEQIGRISAAPAAPSSFE